LVLYSEFPKACTPNWTFTYSGGTVSFSEYYFAGHLDDPFNPTIDINYGVPFEIMYDGAQINYTNNNLYNRYYKKFISEITDKDSKIITAEFKLTPLDISNLDFRKLYLIDNTYFRINKKFLFCNLKIFKVYNFIFLRAFSMLHSNFSLYPSKFVFENDYLTNKFLRNSKVMLTLSQLKRKESTNFFSN
jgi:hypothetical protein